MENTLKLQENTTTIRGNRAKSPGKWTKTERMLGTNHGKAFGKWRTCRKNVVTVEENVTTTRGNGRKHGLKSDGQNIVKTYKRKESNHRKR